MRSLEDRLNTQFGYQNNPVEPGEEEKTEIRQNLERLYDNKSIKNSAKTTIEIKEYQPLESLVPGQWINTSFGDIFRAEFNFNLSGLYGKIDLKQIFDFQSDDIMDLFNLDYNHELESILFLDTETTGLVGGSGTVAFMIGLGWIQKQEFIVHQYFISHMNHEEGMLGYIANFASNFSCIASFNGKSYDIPLLNTRYIINRLAPIFGDMEHIDLLHLSRALWKYTLQNCKLKTLESELMGLFRCEDIPGDMIPEVYFEYLEVGATGRLERIFYHNRFDIISMLGTLLLILQSINNVTLETNPLADYAKGQFFHKKKIIDRSIQHYQNVLKSKITIFLRIATMLELADIYKKEKQIEEAVKLWHKIIDIDYSHSAYIELAKYYEHKEKKYTCALELAEKAVEGLGSHKYKEMSDLSKRINRLILKIEKHKK